MHLGELRDQVGAVGAVELPDDRRAEHVRAHVLLEEFRHQAPARERDELFAYVARANSVVQMIEKEVYTPAPDSAWWCNQRWCGYWDRCPFARPAAGWQRHE